MKKRSIQTMVLVLSLLVLGSCNHKTQTSMMRNVTGKAGELVIVIAPAVWDAAPGEALRKTLAQPQVALPQDEPLFNVIHIPFEGYADIFKTSRNIMEVTVGASVKEPEIKFKRDVYAYTQALITVKAKNNKELLELINSKADKIAGFFLTAERERLSMNYKRYNDKEVREAVQKKFGLTINVPPGFTVAKTKEDKSDFMWLHYETPEISQGIFIYTYPYESDSTFTANYLEGRRNVFLKHNVPAERAGSYMTTEMDLPVFLNSLKVNGNYAEEMRGLWKVEGDFMGGPFVSLSILDLLHNRVVTLDGYVYAPSKNKRNLLRQVAAMIYSVEFDDQADMNKLNRQFEL